MTTTEPTHLGIYEVLQQLAQVKPDPASVAIVAELGQMMTQYEPTIRRAREWLTEHEVATIELVDSIRKTTGCSDTIDDGLMELIHDTSGGDAVHSLLMRLAVLADPDSKYVPEAWT